MTDLSAPSPGPSGPLPPALRPAAVWSAATIAGAAALAALAGLPAGAVALALAGSALAAGLMLRGLVRQGADGFAACHRVTLIRAGLVAVLAGALLEPGMPQALAWAALAAALLALALDGVDGWLARRQRSASAFGARFDMEVDAALIAVLAGLAWSLDKAGAWVLALGLMRYGFVAAAWLWPWLAAPLPHSLRRKTVCVVQVAVLAALLAPPVVAPVSTLMAGAALAALVWSFAVDALWLWRHRHAPGAGA